MGKPTLAVHFSAAALTALGATSASAMPIAPSAAPTSNVEQVHWVCNEWGRCWRQPDYYRPYGYYRRYEDDEWRDRYRYRYGYGYYGPRWGGYGGWRRGWEDDNEQ
jgi:hypothetical protein